MAAAEPNRTLAVEPRGKKIHGNVGIRTTMLVLVAMFATGCTPVHTLYVAYVHSPKSLPLVSTDPPIYVEPGAEDIAIAIKNAFPAAVRKVEQTQGAMLDRLPTVVVCATRACYSRYAVKKKSSGVTLYSKRICINGEKIQRKGKDPAKIITHELTHYFWASKGVFLPPSWFAEGMAVWVSGGGGAEGASVEDALKAIRDGRTIKPTLASGFWASLQNPIKGRDISWPMFYRQSGMFIQYLHDSDPESFARLLSVLREKRDLRTAWNAVYAEPIDAKWAEFVRSLTRKIAFHPLHLRQYGRHFQYASL